MEIVKYIILLPALAVMPLIATAQSAEPDSIKTQELNEVVVEAQMQQLSTVSTSFIPTGKQKSAAHNVISLLQVMAIPQLRIDPIEEKVIDNFGGDVAIFINYFQVSKEEMDGLRTADVRKVEYLEFPTDPRFRGQQKVVNIIVQEYLYGGYTKMSVDENFLLGLSSQANVYSRFSYKRMTYDFYVAANNWKHNHDGGTTKSICSLIKDGEPYNLDRNEILESSRFKQNQYPVTLRATYSSDKIQIRNTVSFQHIANPQIYRSGRLDYGSESSGNYSYEQNAPQRNNSASYSGSFFFSFPRNFSFDVSPVFNYTHTNAGTDYSAGNSINIIRKAREDAYNYRIDGYLRKQVGQNHSFMAGVNGGQWSNNLHYTGSNTYHDKFSNAFAAGLVGYNYRTQKIAVNVDGGIAWENSDINGLKNDDWYPFTHINVRYSLDNKNMFSAYFQYASNTAGIMEKASDIFQENELMYISGNPNLKNSRHTTFNLAYTWMPSNSFGLSAYGQFFGLYDRMFRTYSLYNGGTALIRNWVNDGDYLSGSAGLAFNWKLLNGDLQFYANPEMRFNKITGSCPLSYNPFALIIQAVYFLRQFYFKAYYETPQKGVRYNSNTLYKNRNFYSLTAGWSNSDWNISISAYNVLNKGWETSTWELATPLYSEVRTNYGNYYHPRINLSVTYTFDYGKKVQRGNEVGVQSGANSAIMK